MGMGGWRQVAQPHPMLLQWLTFHSRKGIFLVRKKKTLRIKRDFFKASLPVLPILSRFAAVPWVTVTDQRESSAAAAPEQTAAVIRLEM